MNIYTIGYQGKNYDELLNQLLANNIDLLIDVRNTPLSRKPGFSKNKLKDNLSKAEISYVNIPNIGITPIVRKYIIESQRYDIISDYMDVVLKDNFYMLEEYLNDELNICLLCFEEDPAYCHRTEVAKYIVKNKGGKICHIPSGKSVKSLSSQRHTRL